MRAFGLFVATAGYAGYFPVAPGTAGSAVGLALLVGIRVLGSPGLELGVLVVTVVLGLWASGVGERYAAREDPGLVVIDEVAGMLLTMLWVPLTGGTAVVGFLAFRFFDIVKPFPAGAAERLHGGLGIMADDLIAAVYATAVVRLFVWVSSVLVTA